MPAARSTSFADAEAAHSHPREGVELPASRFRAEHRRSAHAIRCTTDFCSSRRNARGTLASYSSLGDGRDGTSPGGGPRIPFPHTRMNPTSIDVTSTGGIRTRALFSDLRRFHVKPAHSPRKCTPYLPLQSGCTRRDYRIRCASPMHGTRTAPAKADISSTLFHLSTTPSIPSNATYSTADLQYPHSSGVRLVLTCYGT